MVFERLHPKLRLLLQEEGFAEPTPAQTAGVPPILEGRHTLVLAPTGLGKTETALLPVLHRLLEMDDTRPYGFGVLYVTPLRALNRDILGRIKHWGAFLGLEVGVRHGDTPQGDRARQAKRPPDLLITTPESIQAMLTGRTLRANLAGVRAVVVDEVHELLDDERGTQLTVALERIAVLAGEFQRIGLSATVGDPETAGRWLVGPGRDVRVVKVPVAKELDVRVETPEVGPGDPELAAKVFGSPADAARLRFIVEAVEAHRSSLVFVNTRRTAEILAARLGFWGRAEIGVHHGSLSRDVRVEAEEAFKRGDLKGLICTSSMELGIDVGSADYVVQVNSPREARRLVQRVGRAGHRLGLVSRGVVVAENADDALEAAVIARRALADMIEPPRVPERPLDVLANQLVAMLIEGDLTEDQALAILRRSYPFRDLDTATFRRVVHLLEGTRLVHAASGLLARRARARVHHVENLSMIPDAATFQVHNAVTRRPVGTLDEAFVVTYVEPGAAFIFQGQTWRVVELGEDRTILVAPVKDPTGAVPSWVGEEIPVPFDVAQEVGRVRGELAANQADGKDAVAWLMARYPINPAAARLVTDQLDEHAPAIVPTDTVATFEPGKGVVVLNACLGSRGNEALGHAVAALVTARTGRTVGLDVDPYRVVFELPPQVPARRVRDVIEELGTLPQGGLEPLLASLLANAPILRFKLVHVARKFGVLERHIDATRVNVGRLLESFRGTPLYEEAVAEVLRERMDVRVAEAFLHDVAAGRVRLVDQSLSAIAKAGLDQGAGLVPPARATGALLDALRQRLLDEEVVVACLHCRDWTVKRRVERVELPPACPRCHAKQATIVRPWHTRSLKLVKKRGPLSAEEQHDLRRLRTAADLVLAHGRRAVMALVARGVGPDTAGRILRRQRPDEEDFLRDVLEAELTYARTRAFWES